MANRPLGTKEIGRNCDRGPAETGFPAHMGGRATPTGAIPHTCRNEHAAHVPRPTDAFLHVCTNVPNVQLQSQCTWVYEFYGIGSGLLAVTPS